MLSDAYICGGVRNPIGRRGGALTRVRADDLAAVPLRALLRRNPRVNGRSVDDVVYGCADQAGEDNHNLGRMAALLAGLRAAGSCCTVNRLCESGLDAVVSTARVTRVGEADLILAGGDESMSRTPYVVGKSEMAIGQDRRMFDSTIGWRFIGPLLKAMYGVDSMPETDEKVAAQVRVSRADQCAFGKRGQDRALGAQRSGRRTVEITPVIVQGARGETKEGSPAMNTGAKRRSKRPRDSGRHSAWADL